MAMLGLRLGSSPQIVATTTPKPVPLIRKLWHQAIDGDPQIVLTRGPTHENEANLAPQFVVEIITRYAGTRLWRQEVEGEVLEEVEGALWTWQMIEATRVGDIPEMERVVMAVDPATTHGEDSDETGVAVAGKGIDGNFYVLRAEGLKLSPEGWGSRVLRLADEFEVDCIVAEVNAGGEMVTSVLRAVSRGRPLPRIRTIHAKRGKVVRAEPVVALYEQGLVKHASPFPALEDQMTRFPVATDHDDLVDALVYALTELAGKRRLTAF
jgi:predicted phage terminase large subunit-like protein